MKKLKMLWRKRDSWSYAFFYWKCLMFPHLYEKLPDNISKWWDAWWFWTAINNYGNTFDDCEL